MFVRWEITTTSVLNSIRRFTLATWLRDGENRLICAGRKKINQGLLHACLLTACEKWLMWQRSKKDLYFFRSSKSSLLWHGKCQYLPSLSVILVDKTEFRKIIFRCQSVLWFSDNRPQALCFLERLCLTCSIYLPNRYKQGSKCSPPLIDYVTSWALKSTKDLEDRSSISTSRVISQYSQKSDLWQDVKSQKIILFRSI